jgi:hypothetical protein
MHWVPFLTCDCSEPVAVGTPEALMALMHSCAVTGSRASN